MRRWIWCVAAALLLVCCAGAAMAQNMSFPTIHMDFTVPDKTFDVVLTKDSLESGASFLEKAGMTLEQAQGMFENDGVLMLALNEKDGVRLVLTALEDVDAGTIFNINEQPDEVRRNYRVSHTNGTAYGVLGFTYQTAEWKRYDGNRFLSTKYYLKENDETLYRGYQRRTIYNGYTITLDWQIYGRGMRTTDNATLEKIAKTIKFTQTLPMPALPCRLALSSVVPTETNQKKLTLAGTTNPGAAMSAVMVSATTQNAETFTATAGKSGSFKLPITFPSQGVFYITLTVNATGALENVFSYTVTYRENLLPLTITTTVPDTVTEDKLVISGVSTQGAKAQCSVNGKTTSKTVGSKGTFSFTIDTSAEGKYDVLLMFSKKNLETKQINYVFERVFTAEERLKKIRDGASSPSYANLSKSVDSYDGRLLGYTGYIVEKGSAASQTVLTVALSYNKGANKYSQFIVVISEEAVDFPLYAKVRVYGVREGSYEFASEDGKSTYYPRLTAQLVESGE